VVNIWRSYDNKLGRTFYWATLTAFMTKYAKTVSLQLVSISLPNIDHFFIFLLPHSVKKFTVSWLLNVLPYLNCVATLPCEIQIYVSQGSVRCAGILSDDVIANFPQMASVNEF